MFVIASRKPGHSFAKKHIWNAKSPNCFVFYCCKWISWGNISLLWYHGIYIIDDVPLAAITCVYSLQFIVLMNQCFLFLEDISSMFTSFPTLLAVFLVRFRWDAELQDLLLAPKSTAFVQDATGLHTHRYLRGEIGSLCNFQLGKEPKGKCIKHRFYVCQIFQGWVC